MLHGPRQTPGRDRLQRCERDRIRSRSVVEIPRHVDAGAVGHRSRESDHLIADSFEAERRGQRIEYGGLDREVGHESDVGKLIPRVNDDGVDSVRQRAHRTRSRPRHSRRIITDALRHAVERHGERWSSAVVDEEYDVERSVFQSSRLLQA